MQRSILLLAVALAAGMWLRPVVGQQVVSAENAAKMEVDPAHAEKMQAGLSLFKSSVRDVLIKTCVDCHGGSEVESGFDLATRKGLVRGGSHGPAIIPGKSAESNVVRFVSHREKPFMPEGGDRLPAETIDAISRWIDLGAPYDRPLVENPRDPDSWVNTLVPESAREYWAFRPLASPQPPLVKNEAWVRNPIDRFILAKLEEKGIGPSAEAEARVLIRRAYFDLVGLPPQVDGSAERGVRSGEQGVGSAASGGAEDSEREYEAVIDRLLVSPHYGERWARHWLDAARFAESHGFEQDYDRPHAYHFRDFVIEALNQDMPYDQFVSWQLAGDELAPGSILALKATGFLGAGVFPTQITANEVERTRYDALDDMAATVGTAMLGLSIGCARCHDHKFDPIPQADYYRLLSTFTTTVRSNIEVNLEPEAYGIAKAAFDEEHRPLVAAVKRFEEEQLPARLAEWEQSEEGIAARQSAWIVLDVGNLKSNGGATLARQDDGSILAAGTNPDTDWFTFSAKTRVKEIRSIRVEALTDPSLPQQGPGRSESGSFLLTDFKVRARLPKGEAAQVVALKNGRATAEQAGQSAGAAIDDNEASGWSVGKRAGGAQAAVFDLVEPVAGDAGVTLSFEVNFKKNKQQALGSLRVSIWSGAEVPTIEAGSGRPESVLRVLATEQEKRSAEQTAGLIAWYRHRDAEWQKLQAIAAEHAKGEPQPKLVKIMACSEGVTPLRHHTQGADFFPETYFLKRGDCDQKMGRADQSFLQVLMSAPEKEKHWQVAPPEGSKLSYRRRALAGWITDTEYGAGQVLARVIVNRLWQHHFGRGIVATPNDFGVQGGRPTHPELLDWLAGKLIRGGWRLKPIHRLIMTSATYRQGSGERGAWSAERGVGGDLTAGDQRIERSLAPSSEFRAPRSVDPENQFLWRQNMRRLEAEVIRDSLLAVSGRLDPNLYGPGTLDENHTRRSIYFMVKRSKLIPIMQLFDQPEPLVSVGERPSTTIAPQALAFLNGPQVRACARALAEKTRAVFERSPEAAVERAYEMAVGRGPDVEELSAALRFVSAQTASYARDRQADPAALALTDFCQVLFGLNEFVYVE